MTNVPYIDGKLLGMLKFVNRCTDRHIILKQYAPNQLIWSIILCSRSDHLANYMNMKSDLTMQLLSTEVRFELREWFEVFRYRNNFTEIKQE